jgi:agmatinase
VFVFQISIHGCRLTQGCRGISLVRDKRVCKGRGVAACRVLVQDEDIPEKGTFMSLEDAKRQVDLAFTGKARGLAFENAFGGAPSFLRRRYTKDLTGFDLAFTGVPFDQAVTNRPGTRLGPRAIREASALQPFDPPYGWGFDPLEEFAVADFGDLAFDYAQVSAFPATLQAHIAGILAQGCGVISLGGDHYISFPILRAFAEKFGPLSLIHFDAHSDTWPDDDMTRIDHGTMFYKAVKEGLIVPQRSVQIGIRTTNEDTLGVHTIDARTVHEAAPGAVAARVKEIVGNHKAYVTFDIDCLDPAFAPGTGTPVWGGLSSAQAAHILRDLAGINMVGGDIVEVSPPYDTTGATAIAGAHVATELMCLWCWTRRKGIK